MSTTDDMRAAELRAEEADRRLQIYETDQDAIDAFEHSWKFVPFFLADTAAAAVVLGLAAAAQLMGCLFVNYYAGRARTGPLLLLVLGAFGSLGLLVMLATRGPFQLGRIKHPKLVANVTLTAWLFGYLILAAIILSLSTS